MLSPDPTAEPEAVVVTVDTGERLQVLDWGRPAPSPVPAAAGWRLRPPLLLLHGLGQTGWIWTPLARRLRTLTHVLAPDLRGHGLSESPRGGYDLESLAFDALTVLTAHGYGPQAGGTPAVVAGHGFGALVAAQMAALSPAAVAGLVLIDGGWEVATEATGLDEAEFLRGLDEPPEVLASMAAYLADREAWDPATWDADQVRAARAAVDEKYQGRVVFLLRRHARAGCVAAMFVYQPADVLPRYQGPLLVVVAEAGGADDEVARERRLALDELLARRAGAAPARVVRFAGVGHNVMRYRPHELATELAAFLARVDEGGPQSQR